MAIVNILLDCDEVDINCYRCKKVEENNVKSDTEEEVSPCGEELQRNENDCSTEMTATNRLHETGLEAWVCFHKDRIAGSEEAEYEEIDEEGLPGIYIDS